MNEENKNQNCDSQREENTNRNSTQKLDLGTKPTPAFVGASWAALGIGLISYCIGLWNSDMLLNEKGYYFTVILFGLFSAISVQKCVRDKSEGIPVTDIYYGISWFTTITSIVLLVVGLRNADLWLSEKGFFGMAFTLALFAAVAVQKNTRDLKIIDENQRK
ncbi:MAG: hypothetical protein KDC84_14015 [Crocinitomicaceae bacterium]|nr:hypothetical protein [Crocinitomicaceae bacterium]